ncbi:PTS sugar transporter subunit IIA [Uliginosibacterium sp. H3]|uniref:PTS sugar transporter subunit IIA n=1 Tax=Uliginosibacterium silvisoli TaxID=3114758 RepID=A0ABU6K1F0_9RHOO|nr:PTS sugar transporter subunit IIA [Uliginosibacterium sp. H3]
MNLISKILPTANVLVDFQATAKTTVFETAGVVFERQAGMSSKLVTDALTQREKLCSTGLGQGVAIPHGRIKGLKAPLGAFVRMAQPIPFDAPDGKPVSLIFIMLVPEQANESHLQLLSELAQMFSDREFRDALSAASDAHALHSLFAEWNPNAANQRRPAV